MGKPHMGRLQIMPQHNFKDTPAYEDAKRTAVTSQHNPISVGIGKCCHCHLPQMSIASRLF
ncbi:CLUMA_CG014657, isoform A [Clunio marinus]|uniref:CLUMA_CG014657, isoform A n=1 Tax=Clunio marinus TaxID=568069 RepID=A0A1J1ILW7_9DIPT|nr:CLUMA_CG014657, isoform A [Clunio marinus]